MTTDARPATLAGHNPKAPLFAVRLIDRRSGLPLRANGRPVIAFTKTPRETAAEALAGRDPKVWEVRIEPIGASAVGGQAAAGSGSGAHQQERSQ